MQIKSTGMLPTPDPHDGFALLETLLWEPDSEWFLLDRHIHRLSNSARYFGYPFVEDSLRAKLHQAAKTFAESHKVRVLLHTDGEFHIESAALETLNLPIRLALAREPVSSVDPFMQHKTTNRGGYDHFLNLCERSDDVVLWNERGELTECCLGNICLRFGDQWLTPDLSSGCLAGTYRDHLLKAQKVAERTLKVDALMQADELAFINSVRKWCPAKLVDED